VVSFARLLRVWPPIEENEPPTNRSLPESATAFTVLLAPGFHELSAAPVLDAATRPMKRCDWPPMLTKLPPAYTKLASEASASTDPVALATQVASGVPEFVVESFTRRVWVVAFTWVKLPPA